MQLLALKAALGTSTSFLGWFGSSAEFSENSSRKGPTGANYFCQKSVNLRALVELLKKNTEFRWSDQRISPLETHEVGIKNRFIFFTSKYTLLKPRFTHSGRCFSSFGGLRSNSSEEPPIFHPACKIRAFFGCLSRCQKARVWTH